MKRDSIFRQGTSDSLIASYPKERKISPNNTIPVNLAPDKLYVEAVEKAPKEILGQDVERKDLTECATINDLILEGSRDPRKLSLNCNGGLFLQAR